MYGKKQFQQILTTLTYYNLVGVDFQRIQFAREDSDVIAKAKGTYVERPKKHLVGKRDERKKKTAQSKENAKKASCLAFCAILDCSLYVHPFFSTVESDFIACNMYQFQQKETRPPNAKELPPEKANPPNKILFCTNLPEETTEQMLSLLFNP